MQIRETVINGKKREDSDLLVSQAQSKKTHVHTVKCPP